MKGRHLLWQFLAVILVLAASDSGNAREVPTYAYHYYEQYKTRPHFRAFVITSSWKQYGVATYYYRSSSIDAAIAGALDNCQKIAMDGKSAATSFDCKLHSIGNIFVHGMNDEELATAIKLYEWKHNSTNKDLVGFNPEEAAALMKKEEERKAAELAAQQSPAEVETALLAPSEEEKIAVDEDEFAADENVKRMITQYYDNLRIRKMVSEGPSGKNSMEVQMKSIDEVRVQNVVGNKIRANVKFRWEEPDTRFGRNDQGIATLEKIGASYRVIKFETDGSAY